jgi:hypothetical protein
MSVVLGLIILVAAVVVGVAGVFDNVGSGHAVTHGFSLFGYHLTGSTGALFLYGIVVGAAGMLGLALLLAGARRTSRRGRGATPRAETVSPTDSSRQPGPRPDRRGRERPSRPGPLGDGPRSRGDPLGDGPRGETARAKTARADEATRAEQKNPPHGHRDPGQGG